MAIESRNASIIIPTLNEARCIGTLIDEILEHTPNSRIIVADDGSNDGTQEVVRDKLSEGTSNIYLLERTDAVERGITASVLDGIDCVETSMCIVMDGDLQHPPEAIPAMLQELEGGAQLVAGYRLPYTEVQALHRVLATRVSTWLAKLSLRSKGVKVRDPMSGFFAFRTADIKSGVKEHKDRFEGTGYKVLFDILRTFGHSLEIAEVPYEFRIRLGGKSKLAPKHGWVFSSVAN